MISDNQIPSQFKTIINDQEAIYDSGRSMQFVNEIPDSAQIPIQDQRHWLRIPDVICVYVDMMDSTKLSAELHDRSTAGAYQLYTGTAVRLFHEFDAPYIDVRGDGVFALFNGDQPYTALAAAVTFKTFAKKVFVPKILDRTKIDVGSHIGIDMKTVLVRKLGLRRKDSRTDRQNEVWAGKPVNMAAKLATISDDDELLASERFFLHLKDDHALLTCGCPNGIKTELWAVKDLTQDDRFDFSSAYSLSSIWCKTHGAEFCETLLDLDN